MNPWELIVQELSSRLGEEEISLWITPIKYVGTVENELYLKVPDKVFLEGLRSSHLPLIEEILGGVNREISLKFILPEGDSSQETSKQPNKFHSSHILSNYTFDNFVIGEGNKFAHALALAVSKETSSFNPVYIYGGVGLGKTHLLNAIGNYIHTHTPEKSVVYKTSKEFLDEMVYALQNQRSQNFSEAYKNLDVLIIDDIQLISTWEATKKELFFIFNDRYEKKKQIIISSDCPPKEIKNLEERLRTRFEWGVIAQIDPPDLETRIAIINQKLKEKGITLSSDIVEFIASKIKTNVRTLEGALTRIFALSSLRGDEVTIRFVRETIKDYMDVDKEITPEAIVLFVSEKYGIKPFQLAQKNNSPAVSFPRQIAMYLLKEIVDLPLALIGKEFGNKHHTTVLHSIKKIEAKIKDDPDFEKEISGYIRRFKEN